MCMVVYSKVTFTNYVDNFLAVSDHPLPSVDIFYPINFNKKSKILDYLPPPLVNVVFE